MRKAGKGNAKFERLIPFYDSLTNSILDPTLNLLSSEEDHLLITTDVLSPSLQPRCLARALYEEIAFRERCIVAFSFDSDKDAKGKVGELKSADG